MIVRDEVTKEYKHIACDKCGDAAPPTEEIMAGHGLNNMGWCCSGGTHICPKHDDD